MQPHFTKRQGRTTQGGVLYAMREHLEVNVG